MVHSNNEEHGKESPVKTQGSVTDSINKLSDAVQTPTNAEKKVEDDEKNNKLYATFPMLGMC